MIILNKLYSVFKKSLRNLADEKGQSMVEYGLMIALVAVVLMATVISLQTSIRDLYPVLEPSFTPIT